MLSFHIFFVAAGSATGRTGSGASLCWSRPAGVGGGRCKRLPASASAFPNDNDAQNVTQQGTVRESRRVVAGAYEAARERADRPSGTGGDRMPAGCCCTLLAKICTRIKIKNWPKEGRHRVA